MSVQIKIDNAVKKYGNNVIIPSLNLTIKEGEFFTLPGPLWLRKNDATSHDRRIQFDRRRRLLF